MTTATQQHALRFEVNECGIATLWLDGGEKSVVVLDRNLIQRLNKTLDTIEQTQGIKGLVLRSDCDRVFVAGADLVEIDALDNHGLHAYLAFGTTVFARISALPYPTVATINGATLGGGLEIAMHCDALIASKTNAKNKAYPIGLPEAGLGLCPGWGGTQMLPARIDPETAIVAVATGTTFMSSDIPKGLIATFVDTPAALQDAAEQWIQEHDTIGTTPIAINKDNATRCREGLAKAKTSTEQSEAANAVFLAIETGIENGWAAAVAVEQCELVRLRSTSAAREKLDAFLSKG